MRSFGVGHNTVTFLDRILVKSRLRSSSPRIFLLGSDHVIANLSYPKICTRSDLWLTPNRKLYRISVYSLIYPVTHGGLDNRGFRMVRKETEFIGSPVFSNDVIL